MWLHGTDPYYQRGRRPMRAINDTRDVSGDRRGHFEVALFSVQGPVAIGQPWGEVVPGIELRVRGKRSIKRRAMLNLFACTLSI
jgi:hypothetical protein